MNLAAVIDRLRTQAPSLSSRVFGAARFEATDLRVADGANRPCAFVMLTGDNAQNATGEIGLVPDILDTFGVVLVLANTSDDDGFSASQGIDALRTEVFGAILNWSPASGYLPIQYVGGRLVASNPASYLWQLTFSTLRTGGSILSYEIGVALKLSGSRTPAQVLADAEAKIAIAVSGSRMSDDYLHGRESIPASATRFRVRGLATALAAIDTNQQHQTLTVIVTVLRHLAAGDSERAYTEAAMQTAVSALLADGFWFSDAPGQGISGVLSIISSPEIHAFPGDVERRV